MRGIRERIFSKIDSSIASSLRLQAVQEALIHQNISHNDLDVIVITGASMDYNKRRGRWRFGTIVHAGIGKIDAGNSRTIAAKQIVDEGYQGIFLVTGGDQRGPQGESVSQAVELARVMTRKRRMENVIPIGRATSTNTHGNAADAAVFLANNRDRIVHGKIGLLANEWHIIRAMLIFKEHPFFQQEGIEIVPIDANEVLIRRSKLYHIWNSLVRHHPAMDTKVNLEVEGIQDLLAGRYKPRH